MSAKTLISATNPFATAADMVTFRDWRHIADFLNDDDTRVASSASVQGNATLLTMLRVASGEVETALYRGGRYTKDDLAAIASDVTGTLVKDFLKELVCNLAFWKIVKRRKPDANPRAVSGVPEALETLAAMKLGEAILPFQEVTDASVMDYTPTDPNRSKSQVNSTPLSTQANRLFGSRTRTY